VNMRENFRRTSREVPEDNMIPGYPSIMIWIGHRLRCVLFVRGFNDHMVSNEATSVPARRPKRRPSWIRGRT
jgi:hypothetical protein